MVKAPNPAGAGAMVGSTMMLGGYGTYSTADYINGFYASLLKVAGMPEAQLIDLGFAFWSMLIGALFLGGSIYAWMRKRG